MSDPQIRDLTTIDEFKQVVELEKTIWGYTDSSDMVGVPVFIFTVHRGAVLIGALTPPAGPWPEKLVGFAYAVAGMKAGRPMLWSHMTGVLPEHRGGLGYRLKLAQRERALSHGYDLIEWTFDPMQAMNAHFNFAKLGGVVTEYAPNFYGESTSALHRGTPTDRVVLSWNISAPHVLRRLEAAGLRARAQEVADAPIANTTAVDGEWRKNATIDLDISERRVWLEIPTGFTEMQRSAPDRALQWRLDLRAMFETYLSKGYRAVDFVLQREAGFGRYLLARE
jgi:predicted GNAT superfamily acetyltransferase